MTVKTCQYCNGELANPSHNNCQWCNVLIAEANCNGVYDKFMAAAEALRARDDLGVEARRAALQSAYDSAMQKV